MASQLVTEPSMAKKQAITPIAEDKGQSRHWYNLSHQDAVGVDIALCRRLPAAEKLWRHPEGTPHDLGPHAAVEAAACKTKVRHLGAEYRVDQHVPGLEVCTDNFRPNQKWGMD
jgi:hypothetical protein